MGISISVSESSFDHGSKVVGTIYENANQLNQTDAILKELREIRIKLDETAALKQAIISLEEAIRNQDNPKISKIVGQLSSNFSSSLLANVASSGLLTFLGIT